jgi:putative iron-regulated protein
VVEQLLEAMIGILDEVANGKMTDPLGASLAAADTSLVESQYAWNSLTDFHNNIQSALNIYTGIKGFNPNSSTPSVNNYGLYTFVAFSDKALADQIHTEIKDAYNAIALIDGDNDVTTTEITSNAQMPFRQAIKDVNGRTRVQSAIDKLNKARSTLETKVKPLIAKTAFSG